MNVDKKVVRLWGFNRSVNKFKIRIMNWVNS